VQLRRQLRFSSALLALFSPEILYLRERQTEGIVTSVNTLYNSEIFFFVLLFPPVHEKRTSRGEKSADRERGEEKKETKIQQTVINHFFEVQHSKYPRKEEKKTSLLCI
jgi:hypothetical protein